LTKSREDVREGSRLREEDEPVPQTDSTEKAVLDIRRKTRRKFSAEEKIRIVLEGLRGEESVASPGVSGCPVGWISDSNPTSLQRSSQTFRGKRPPLW
jgi:hypothetical protein